jgi:hypothetical protein
VNVAVVLERFDGARAAGLREAMRAAKAAADLTPMFLLRSELTAAIEAFANKFADIHRRHRVLYGEDVFAAVEVPRAAAVHRLKQVLLNLGMRLRQAYVVRGLHEEQLALAVADAAGPLRASAATLLELEGQGTVAPKEALARVVPPELRAILPALSTARETRRLPAGESGPVLLHVIELAHALRERAAALEP